MSLGENVMPWDDTSPRSINNKFFQDFASFMVDNRLKEAAALNLKLSREFKLPLLDLFNHLSEEEIFALSLKGQLEFFQQVQDGVAHEKARESLLAWKENKVEGISRDQVQITDLVLAYSIRKQVCLHFLPEFTSDASIIISIVQDLELLHQEIEGLAFHIFTEIQHEELNKRNQFLSSLINNSVDGIMAFDHELRVTEWNPAMEESLGRGKEEIIGKSLLEVYPALANSPVMLAFKRALKGETVHLSSGSYVSKPGFYEANIAPLQSEKGDACGGIAFVHDITYRVETEERLKEHQEELLAANEELTEQHEELQVAIEELKQQREEIEAVNEELQESLAQLEEARETLEYTVNQLEEAQSIARLGSFEYFVKDNKIIWSKELRRIFGIYDDNFVLDYEGYLAKLHEDDREYINGVVAQAMKSGQAYSFEHRIRLDDGSIRWLRANGQPVYANGELYKLQGTSLDITEQKLAQLKLEEEQYFVHQITTTSPDVITIFDLDERKNIYGNRELTSVLGYSEEEIIEIRNDPAYLQKLIHPDDLESAMRFLIEFKTYDGKETRKAEYRVKTKSGEFIWVSARYNIFKRDKNGFPSQIIGVTRDVNDRKLAEEELKQINFKLQETNEELVRTEELLKEANNELEEQVLRRTAELQRKNTQLERINADLDNFIYTASHDLKVPIVNLEGLLILINKKLGDKLAEKDQNLLSMMHTSIERFKTTIQDLSDVTKMQKDLEDEVKEIVPLSEVLTDVQKDIDHLINENNASINTSLEVGHIPFDRKNLRSIIYNLLTNAIKYRSDDREPVINVITKKLNGGILLSISDNGEGIPEHQYDKIFSLFKRLHKKVEGSGMGLYIVKRIIENNGGRIEVKSEVGKGSSFNIFLQNEK